MTSAINLEHGSCCDICNANFNVLCMTCKTGDQHAWRIQGWIHLLLQVLVNLHCFEFYLLRNNTVLPEAVKLAIDSDGHDLYMVICNRYQS